MNSEPKALRIEPALAVPTRGAGGVCVWLVLAGIASLGATPGRAQSDAARGFDRFAILAQRNIFDPERRPYRPREERRQEQPKPRAEELRLTGAVVYSDKSFGFFAGSDSEFNRVVSVGDSIAGMEVAKISTGGVVLKAAGEERVMNVGQALRREGAAPWKVADVAIGSRSSGQEPGASEKASAAEETPEGGDANDLVRQMMERRRREMTQ